MAEVTFQTTSVKCLVFWEIIKKASGECVPDDHNNAIKYVVGVLDVPKGSINQNLQQHLQRKQAGEYDVTDLQSVGQFFRLEETEKSRTLNT